MNAPINWFELAGWLSRHASNVDMVLVQSIVTSFAVFWVLYRAWLTLSRPVPELISVLGIQVPEVPQVSLAGIKSDSVTLQWARPAISSTIQKYLIQVNGVDVGYSSRLETAITVTGLKPHHYYNIRVVSVSSDGFRSNSSILRLRTYGVDGQPRFGTDRLATSVSPDQVPSRTSRDGLDEIHGHHNHGSGHETISSDNIPATGRQDYGGSVRHRRNAGKHRSASNTSQGGTAPSSPARIEESGEDMQQLTERFDAIRRETEEVTTLLSTEAEEHRIQLADIVKERDAKRQILKEKEEVSERLKKEVHAAERANRQSQNRKTAKEKALKDKEAEQAKAQNDEERWTREIREMDAKMKILRNEQLKMETSTEKKLEEHRKVLQTRHDEMSALEEEIRLKGLQVKDLEEARRKQDELSSNAEAKERESAERQKDTEWVQKERDLSRRYQHAVNMLHTMENQLRDAQIYYQSLLRNQTPDSSPVALANITDNTGRTSAASSTGKQAKSHPSSLPSPMTAYSSTSSPYHLQSTNNSNTHSPAFTTDNHLDRGTSNTITTSVMAQSELAGLTGDGLLSPNATNLIPSELFAENDPFDQSVANPLLSDAVLPMIPTTTIDSPSSPVSSNHSTGRLSSPHVYSRTMLNSRHTSNSDRNSLSSVGAEFGIIGSPKGASSQSSHNVPDLETRFQGLFDFAGFNGKASDNGPLLGKLRLSQSSSFPRPVNDGESPASRARRTSLSSGWAGLPFLNRNQSDGNGPALSRAPAVRRLPFKMFGSTIEDAATEINNLKPESPKPASVASFDLPRPSTDSAPFGWPVVAVEPTVNGHHSPLAANWSFGSGNQQPWVSHASSPAQLKSKRLSAYSSEGHSSDDFFPAEQAKSRSSPLAPIGASVARPQSSGSNASGPKLNPAAPTFTFNTMFGRSKSDKTIAKRAGKSGEPAALTADTEDGNLAVGPSQSRKSRDQHSIYTSASTTSESRTSLDHIISNATASEAGGSAASRESSFQKLLRKGSGKFLGGSFRVGKGKTGARVVDDVEEGAEEAGFEDDGISSWNGAGAVSAAAGTDSPAASTARSTAARWGKRFSVSKGWTRGEGGGATGEVEET